MKFSAKQFLGIILSIVLITCILIICGCTSTKHLDTSLQTKEEVKTINTDSLVKSRVDSTRKHYEELLRTLDADIIFNNPCDSFFRDTGSVRVVNTVKYIPGKGFEASGNIKSFKLRESELLKSLDSMHIDVEHYTRLTEQAQDSLKVEIASRKLDKKTKVFNLWWLLFVGYVLGWQFPPSKWLPKVKSLFTKI